MTQPLGCRAHVGRPPSRLARGPAAAASAAGPEVDTTDWPAQAADTIERAVQGVRDKTTGPAITAARWVVAGLFLVIIGTTVAILLSIALVRVLDVYLPESVFGETHVWAAYLILGLPVFIAGIVLLAQAQQPRSRRLLTGRTRNKRAGPVVLTSDPLVQETLMTDPTDVRDVIIIGSGPAGLTAAVYTARANLAPLVIEGEPSSTSDQPGGQLMLTTEVENYPGFPEGIMGPELMVRFREQALRFGADIRTEKVSRVDLSARPFGVWVGDPDAAEPTYRGRSLILSTGAQSLMLGLENEARLIGHGVSTCATCDGFFFRDHEIAVVGGGDSAVEEAMFLTKFATKVTMIVRRDQLRASKIMQDRAFANPKIEIRWNSVVKEIVGDTKLDHIVVEDVQTGERADLPVTGLFVAIGHKPNTDLVKGQLELEDNGYLDHRPARRRVHHQRGGRVRLR